MKAYITLLSNEKYLPGVIVLNKSLRALGARYPLYCALSLSVNEKTERILVEQGITCIRLKCTVVDYLVNTSEKGTSHWNFTFDKLQIWGLTQFEKLVFLDCDMLIVRNLDNLFDCLPFSAVSADCSYPGNESWAGGLNSGLMVIEPDKEVEKGLLESVAPVIALSKEQNKMVGDQDVIKYYLSDWGKCTDLHLDEGYNLFADHLTYYIRHLGYRLTGDKGKPIYVIHFIGRSKPWMKKTLREYVWMCRMCLKNPYYVTAYRRFVKTLKS